MEFPITNLLDRANCTQWILLTRADLAVKSVGQG
jgi:hypothetical protein